MRFEHNTMYWGYDILTTISHALGRPVVDRGGVYMWLGPVSDDPIVILYDSAANDFRGLLEAHRATNGMRTLGKQIDVLSVLKDGSDLFFEEDKIKNFIRDALNKQFTQTRLCGIMVIRLQTNKSDQIQFVSINLFTSP